MIHNNWHSMIRHYHVVPVVVNNIVLCWASRWESRIERCASGCESLCYAEPVVVNHSVLCCASRCEPWRVMRRQWLHNMIHNHCHNMIRHDSQPLAKHSTTWFTTTGTGRLAIIYNHWRSIAEHDSQPQWLLIIVSYAESEVVNGGVLCWASYCEALWAMLSSVCMNHCVNAVPVDINHGEVC
jgi:hypothetical protein